MNLLWVSSLSCTLVLSYTCNYFSGEGYLALLLILISVLLLEMSSFSLLSINQTIKAQEKAARGK
jgi:hypothetical protein